MRRFLSGITILFALIFSGCTSPAMELPLADDRPTMLFFYTDG